MGVPARANVCEARTLMKLTVPLIILSLFLTCCAPRTAKPIAKMDRQVRWPVLALSQNLPSQVGMHHITLKKDGREFRFETTVEMEPNHQAMVGMTPVGTVGFSLQADATSIQFERIPFYKLILRPEEILTAYQWTFLDRAVLSNTLAETGLRLREPDDQTREIIRGNETIATIEYESKDIGAGTAVFKQPERQLSIHFLTRSLQRF